MRGGDTRFVRGQSGNPSGRPKQRRPNVSAFDIVFDQVLHITQNGVERELTVDEALQLQTYQAALKGKKMAIRAVLKMIEKREVALAKRAPVTTTPVKMQVEYDSDNANRAMQLLGIADWGAPPHGGGPATRPLKLTTWATQLALSRPGRPSLSEKDMDDVKRLTLNPEKLKWPRRRAR